MEESSSQDSQQTRHDSIALTRKNIQKNLREACAKFKFNHGWGWKEEAAMNYNIPGLMLDSNFGPSEFFEEIWERGVYFRTYVRMLHSSIGNQDFLYPTVGGDGKTLDLDADGPGQAQSEKYASGRYWAGHSVKNENAPFICDIMQVKVTACYSCIKKELDYLNKVCETQIPLQVLGFVENDLGRCRCNLEDEGGVQVNTQLAGLVPYEFVELSPNIDFDEEDLEAYQTKLESVENELNYYREKLDSFLKAQPVLGKFEKLSRDNLSYGERTEWSVLLTFPFQMIAPCAKIRRKSGDGVAVKKQQSLPDALVPDSLYVPNLPEQPYVEHTKSLREKYKKYTNFPGIEEPPSKVKRETPKLDTVPPVFALPVNFTSDDIKKSIEKLCSTIQIPELGEYEGLIHGEKMSEVLNKCGYGYPKRKKLQNETKRLMEAFEKVDIKREEAAKNKSRPAASPVATAPVTVQKKVATPKIDASNDPRKRRSVSTTQQQGHSVHEATKIDKKFQASVSEPDARKPPQRITPNAYKDLSRSTSHSRSPLNVPPPGSTTPLPTESTSPQYDPGLAGRPNVVKMPQVASPLTNKAPVVQSRVPSTSSELSSGSVVSNRRDPWLKRFDFFTTDNPAWRAYYDEEYSPRKSKGAERSAAFSENIFYQKLDRPYDEC